MAVPPTQRRVLNESNSYFVQDNLPPNIIILSITTLTTIDSICPKIWKYIEICLIRLPSREGNSIFFAYRQKLGNICVKKNLKSDLFLQFVLLFSDLPTLIFNVGFRKPKNQKRVWPYTRS